MLPVDFDWITLRNMENWIYMNPRLAKFLKAPRQRHKIQTFLTNPTKEVNRILKSGVYHGVIFYNREFTRYAIFQLSTVGKILLEEYENANYNFIGSRRFKT